MSDPTGAANSKMHVHEAWSQKLDKDSNMAQVRLESMCMEQPLLFDLLQLIRRLS